MLRRMVTTFLVLQTAMIGVAWACSCAEEIPPEDALASYDAAFVGRAVKTRRGCEGFVHRSTHQVTTVMEVEEAFTGVEVGERVEITHGEDDASCGVVFEDDAAYLVFADPWEGELHTALCDPGGPVGEVRDYLDAVRALTE